ncbi:MAG: peroxidase [Mariniblastus sp.]|jgi:peroxidase
MKKKKRKSRVNRLSMECLEDRKLLAADLGFSGVLQEGISDFDRRPEIVQGNMQRNDQPTEERGRPGDDATDRTQIGLVDLFSVESRTIDGTGNNLVDSTLGGTESQLIRSTTVDYADGISDPAGADRPSAREISNTVAAQVTTDVNERGLTDITWLFGQFIDHDIDLSEGADPEEAFDIVVPAGDVFFDPTGSGEAVISLNRTVYNHETGTSAENPRQQINQITSFLDGSVIYGSDETRAAELRTFEGGLLKTSAGDLLPFNDAGLDNAGGTSESLFLAGDIRANENIALTAMQTLWVREHNSWAEQISAEDPTLSDEEVFQAARTIVTAELQAITFNEYLPALLGEDAVSDYAGYDAAVNPGISNVFSGAAYRFGHSMLSTELLRLNADGTEADEGNISLQSAFFASSEISENGIDSLLMGAASQVANEVDNQVVDDIRNFLFGAPGSGGFDLASLNIQRGRDHGLADYNQTREDYGLNRVTDFDQITSDSDLAQALEDLYGSVDNIDVWVGGLAEDHVAGSSMGELFSTVIVDQFERIRDGDRLWYEEVFSGRQLDAINRTSLTDIIERNTELDDLQANVFFESGSDLQPEDFNDRRRQGERPNRRSSIQMEMGGRQIENRRDSGVRQRLPSFSGGINDLAGSQQIYQRNLNFDFGDGRQTTNDNVERSRRNAAIDNVFSGLDRDNAEDAGSQRNRRGRGV